MNINQFIQCAFKIDSKSPVITYSPNDILAYRFDNNGKFFVSKEVPTLTGTKVFFLEYLIKGKANIYFRRDNNEHYYIQKEVGDLMELTETPVLSKNEEGLPHYKPQKYTGKLKYVLSDCPDLFDEIDGLKLYSTQLIKLAKDYHDKVCESSKCIVFERKINPLKFNFVVLSGISYNDFIFSPENYTDKRIGALIGCNLEIQNLFFSFERMTVSTGVTLQYFSTYTLHTDSYQANNVIYSHNKVTDIDMRTGFIKIPVSFNYTLNYNKLQPYFGLGLTNTFYITQNKDLFVNDYNTYFGQAIPFYHLGVLGIFGVKFKLNNLSSG